MLREKRQAQILDILKQDRLVTILDLSRRLEASYMTVWRDLEDLEERGQLRRVRGGAVLPEHSLPGWQSFPWPDGTDEISLRKQAIGRFAARELVSQGDTLTLEAGTTTSSMVPFLDQPDLTVLTNGLITSALAYSTGHGNLTWMCSGGILIDTGAFTGPQAEEFFLKFRVKKAFVGAKGLSLEDGFTDPTPLYTNLKTVMKRMTETLIVLLDSSKFGVRSLVRVLALQEVNILVTDAGAPSKMVAELRERGIDVRIAD
jgi:DeoR family transcriptional regulator, fructose operon transcriptional repressor